MKKSLNECLYDIGMGTCGLTWYCLYADAIRMARMCFSSEHRLDEYGIPINYVETPNWEDIVSFSRDIVDMYNRYRCVCPDSDSCKTAMVVNELIQLVEDYDIDNKR